MTRSVEGSEANPRRSTTRADVEPPGRLFAPGTNLTTRRTFVSTLAAGTAGLLWDDPRLLGAQSRPPSSSSPKRFVDGTLDLNHIPFSSCGSYLFATLRERRVCLQTVRRSAATYRWQKGGGWSNELLYVEMSADGRAVEYETRATPLRITLEAPEAQVIISFLDVATLSVRSRGCRIAFVTDRRFTWIDGRNPQVFRAFDERSNYLYTFQAKQRLQFRGGDLGLPTENEGDWLSTTGAGEDDLIVKLAPLPGEEAVLQRAGETEREQVSLSDWMEGTPDVEERYAEAARTGWFLFWDLQVAPEGFLGRQTVLSSKLSLNQTWSWDNCINALALVRRQPALAWEQLLVILDHQGPDGVLPDSLSSAEIKFGFNKPPVWAWTIHRMLPFTPKEKRKAYVERVYPAVAKFHRWWLRERDLVGDGLPCYLSGNDSGWDNASIFDGRWPVQSPDLTAWLILDAEGLAAMAALLELPDEEKQWRARSEMMLRGFHARFASADGALDYFSVEPQGEIRLPSTSLITRVPILLGKRLAPVVRASIVRELSEPGTFLANAGPATESQSSPAFNPAGYWRGPVWAISTYLVCMGLVESGELTLAKDLATRFCDTCSRDGNFRENYNPGSGKGQDDSGMTWTSADFLLLAEWLAETKL